MSKRLAIIMTVIGIAAIAAIFFGSCEPRGLVHNGKSVREWATLLRSPDAAVRDQAAQAIKSLGVQAVPGLIRLVQTKNTGLRKLGWAVAKRLPRRPRAWFFLHVQWPDPNDACVAGAKGLAIIGPDAHAAVPALARVLRGPVPAVRLDCAAALGRIGKASVPVLIDALSDKNLEVRHAAAYALGEVGPDAQAAVPGLIPLLNETNAPLRASVAYSLSRIGLPDLPSLLEVLSHGDSAARDAAAKVLLQYHQELRQALFAFFRQGSAESAEVRQQALDNLGTVREGDLLTIYIATRGLKDLSVPVRLSAITALAQLGSQAQAVAQMVVPQLIESLKDESPLIRANAAQALSRYGTNAGAAVPALNALVQDENESVSAMAKEALRLIRVSTNNLPGH